MQQNYPNADAVDTRSISSTAITSSTTIPNHIAGIAATAIAARNASNGAIVEQLLRELNEVADRARELHL